MSQNTLAVLARVTLLLTAWALAVMAACSEPNTVVAPTASATDVPATLRPSVTIKPTESPRPLPTNTPSPAPTATASPTATEWPMPADVQFVFGPGVSLDQQTAVREGISLAWQFIGASGPVVVYADVDETALITAYEAYTGAPLSAETRTQWETNGFPSQANLGVIYLNLGRNEAGGDEDLRLGVAHEYCHTWQAHIAQQKLSASVSGPDGQLPAIGPVWLVEGFADYCSVQAVSVVDATVREREFASHMERATLGILSDFENRESYTDPAGGAYAHGFLAVNYLAQQFDNPAFAAFWQETGQGLTWDRAFEAMFGKSVPDFYTEFEAYRVGLYPNRVFGSVTTTEGVALGGIYVAACPVQGGTCPYGTTQRDGSYVVILTVSGEYTVTFGYSLNKAQENPTVVTVDGDPVEVNVQMAAGVQRPKDRYVSGVMYGPDGAPLVNISAFACPEPPAPGGCSGNITGADGSFSIAVYDESNYSITFWYDLGGPFGSCYASGYVVRMEPNRINCDIFTVNGNNIYVVARVP